MKKIFLALIMFACVGFGIFADTKSGNYESPISYENIPILKIMEGKDGYVVIYQKYKFGVGSTVVPKSWAKGTPDAPRKLKFRKLQPGIVKPYMTIVKKDGSFHRVILTIPMNKNDAIWGSARNIEGVDKENLDDVVL